MGNDLKGINDDSSRLSLTYGSASVIFPSAAVSYRLFMFQSDIVNLVHRRSRSSET